MKLDFDFLDRMAAAGASAGVIITYLREQYAKGEARRAADRKRKAAEKKTVPVEAVRKRVETSQTVADTPRARLFREGSAAVMSMGRTERASRQLIATWLSLTHDDAQLVLATILKAQELSVSDPAGWILATLRGKTNGANRKQHPADLARDLANEARELERQAGLDRSSPPF